MSAASMLTVTGAVAVTAAVAWGLAHRVRLWRAVVRLRRVQAHHAGMRAELELSDERICIRCATRPAWSAQKLKDMEGVFAQLDGVLERRRLDEGGRGGSARAPGGSTGGPGRARGGRGRGTGGRRRRIPSSPRSSSLPWGRAGSTVRTGTTAAGVPEGGRGSARAEPGPGCRWRPRPPGPAPGCSHSKGPPPPNAPERCRDTRGRRHWYRR